MKKQDIQSALPRNASRPGAGEALADGAMQYYGLTLDKFLRHAAKWHPQAEVITARPDGTRYRVGYAELYERSRRISAQLAALGVRVSSRVATLAWNTQAHIEAWFGIMGIGAACHTLNPRVTAEQSGVMLRQSGAEILIVCADLIPLAEEIVAHAGTVSRIFVIDGPEDAWNEKRTGLTVEVLDPFAIEREPVPWGAFDENTASGLCFTSGTTGAPKGVTYTHRSSYLHTLRMLQSDVMGLTGRDTALAVVPMFHASAWGLPFVTPAVGANLVLPGRKADGASLARLIAAEDVTVAVGVPTVWLGLVEHMEAAGGELPSLERIIVGGAPMPPALMQRLENRLGITVQTSWGMTELSPDGTMAIPGDPRRRPASAGRPAIGVDLLLKGADGKALPEQRDVEGQLHVRGASVLERYLGFETSATDADGWFCTGDLARIDQDGNLFITGRAKDLIKSGGEWINPAEIEAVVAAIPEVSHCAVVGKPDLKWGERPVLIVEMRKNTALTDVELNDALRDKVASWWIPDAIIRIDSMPMASTGKIDKMRLRAEYGQ